jgi:hypothetical protein
MTDYSTADAKNPKAATLQRLVDAGIKARGRFDKVREELERYEYGDEEEDYQAWAPELSFKSKVYKTSQFKREIGSRLYNNNPTFRVEPRKQLGEASEIRSALMEDYLNYIPRECDLFHTMRSVMEDALGPGRGVVWFGVHPRKPGVVVPVQDSVQNLIIDPDARTWSQVTWVARERYGAKWKLVSEFPDKRASILSAKGGAKPSDVDYDESAGGGAVNTQLIKYYEVWLTVGLHNFAGGIDCSQSPDSVKVKDEPKKYVFTECGKLLYEGEWEIPFHLDGTWPCEVLDFYDHPKSIWTISPLQPGLGWQRAINWIATLIVAKYQWCSKTVLAMIEHNGTTLSEEDRAKIESADGMPLEVVSIAVNNLGEDPDIRKYVQQLELHSDINESLALLDHLNKHFEQETGLYEFLYTGQSGAADRSAAATRARESNTKNRIDDMQSRIEDFLSRLGRKLAMTARYLLTPADVSPILGEERAQAWGYLFSQEQMRPEYWMQRYSEQGYDMTSAFNMAQEQADRGVSLEEWLYEVDYTIEGGSTVRNTPEREAAAYENALNTIFPSLVQAGAMRSASELLVGYGKQIGLPQESLDSMREDFARIEQQQQQAAMMDQQAAMMDQQQQQQQQQMQPPPM